MHINRTGEYWSAQHCSLIVQLDNYPAILGPKMFETVIAFKNPTNCKLQDITYCKGRKYSKAGVVHLETCGVSGEKYKYYEFQFP